MLDRQGDALVAAAAHRQHGQRPAPARVARPHAGVVRGDARLDVDGDPAIQRQIRAAREVDAPAHDVVNRSCPRVYDRTTSALNLTDLSDRAAGGRLRKQSFAHQEAIDPRAAARPSLIAHTISDWPRAMSPAANTPLTLVALPSSASRCCARPAPRRGRRAGRPSRGRGSPSPAAPARRPHLLAARHLLHREAAVAVLHPLDANRVHLLQVALPRRRRIAWSTDDVLARVVAEERRRLFLAVVELVDLRPLRPRIVGRARVGRPRQDLELHQALAAVPQRRADAVGAGVAAADDDDVLALGRDVLAVGEVAVEQALGVACRNSIAK